MTVPSVRQIVLLNSTSVRGEVFQRGRDGIWPEEAIELSAGDVVRIEPIGFICALAEFRADQLGRPMIRNHPGELRARSQKPCSQGR